jgi:phosphoribosylformylglycinamidine synthase
LRLDAGRPAHALLFGEDQGRYLVATAQPDAIRRAAAEAGVEAAVIGEAGGRSLTAEGLFDIPLSQLRSTHEAWMPAYMG